METNWTIEQIEEHVDGQLEFVGLARLNEKTKNERLLLFHLYVAAAMFFKLGMENLSWSTIRRYHKECKSTFNFKNFLAEIRKTKKKEKVPPTPPNKETKEGEKTEIINKYNGVASLSSLDERKKAFYADCHKYDVRYGSGMVDDFYCFWSEETSDGFMRFELEKTWSTSKRLFKWSRSPVTKANKIADLRLEQAKNRKAKSAPSLQNTPQQDAVAKKRAADNAQREAEIDKAKEEGMSFAEYQRMHPESKLSETLSKVKSTFGKIPPKPK